MPCCFQSLAVRCWLIELYILQVWYKTVFLIVLTQKEDNSQDAKRIIICAMNCRPYCCMTAHFGRRLRWWREWLLLWRLDTNVEYHAIFHLFGVVMSTCHNKVYLERSYKCPFLFLPYACLRSFRAPIPLVRLLAKYARFRKAPNQYQKVRIVWYVRVTIEVLLLPFECSWAQLLSPF